MNFLNISLSDKILFDGFFKKHPSEISELCFTNLFMWRSYYNFCYTVYNDYLIILADSFYGLPFVFFPIGEYNESSFTEVIIELKKYFNNRGWQLKIRGLTASQSSLVQSICISYLPQFGAEIIFDRDNSDYVYKTTDLISLKGKKFDGKRNHINKFLSNNQYEYIPMNSTHKSDCFSIIDRWCNHVGCSANHSLMCEKKANIELINNFENLECKGCLIKVNGVFEAFSIGEMLNDETAVIHIEKANSHIEGLYQFINQQFCQHTWEASVYINREQDLGLEGLRKAKLSYNPVHMAEKYYALIGG